MPSVDAPKPGASPDGAHDVTCHEDACHEDVYPDGSHSDDAFYRAAHAAQIKAHRRRLTSRPAVPAARARERHRSPSQQAGDTAEDTALRHLERAGLVAVARNLSCRAGEVDLIMRDGDVLVFVEVRSRRDARYGGAAASVGNAKRQRLLRAARYFLHTQWRGAWPRCRFDVVAFDDGALQWIRAAFTE